MLLAGRGYRVIGADLSEDMLAEAEQKARELPEGSRPFFICQPMQRLRLAEPVDAVICALDSLNYLTRPDDCRKTLRRVYNALKSGGLFVFDINTPAYEPDELALWLEEAGFTHIRQYGDRVLRAPKQDEQRIYFSAKKD